MLELYNFIFFLSNLFFCFSSSIKNNEEQMTSSGLECQPPQSQVMCHQFSSELVLWLVQWIEAQNLFKTKRQNSVCPLSLDDFACYVFHFQNGKYRYEPPISFLPVPDYQTSSNSKRKCFFHAFHEITAHMYSFISLEMMGVIMRI